MSSGFVTLKALVIPLDRLTEASADVIEWSQEVHIIKANLYRELTADVDFDMSV
jgi:hypothetical protein